MLKLMRLYFKWLSRFIPNFSSYLGTKLFYTPQKSKQSDAEIAIDKSGCETFIETSQGKLRTLLWLSSSTKEREVVLLAHGWGGRGTQFYQFIEPLLKRYNVVTFDGPAHGASPGKITTLPKYAEALAEICQHFKVSYVIAHSFGAGATAIALARHNVELKCAVLIASPYSVENVVNHFCRHLCIPKKIAEKIHQRMETPEWHGMPRKQLAFSSLGKKIKIPILMFHSTDDRYIDYADGKLAATYLQNVEFITLEKLGHLRPIRDDNVIKKSLNFIDKSAMGNVANTCKVEKNAISLIDIVKARAKSHPNREIYHYLKSDLEIEKSISIAELYSTSSAIAVYINENIDAGARILLIFENSPEFIFCFLGAIFSHAIPVCIDPSKRNLSKNLSYYLDDMQTTHVFAGVDKLDFISSCVRSDQVINLHTFKSVLTNTTSGETYDLKHSVDDICFIQYTSGATGQPKGVVVSHENIISNCEQITSAFQATPNSIGLSWLPHFHDMGLVGGLIEPLFADFPVYIMSHKVFAQRPVDWLRAIDRYRVTISGGPNIAYEYLNKQQYADSLNLSCWQVAFIGADFISSKAIRKFADVMAKFKFRETSLVPCYGMAEATLMVCSHQPGVALKTYSNNEFKVSEHMSAAAFYIAADIVSCGKVNTFTDVIIVNNNQLCAEKVVGEICLSGKNIVKRYWGKPLEHFSSYIRTGDIGVLVDGELFVIGRSKELLIINGINISPAEIEQDIQATNNGMLPGRGIVYQDTPTSIGLIQEVEKKTPQLMDWQALSQLVQQTIYKKYGIAVSCVKFVKRGALASTSSGKLIRAKRHSIKSTAVLFSQSKVFTHACIN